jgi:uncharacterized repeat protein (TIGR01451 family)
MRHVIRGGGSNASRRSERTRVVALVATFLLLMAGFVVSAPGLIASASGTTTANYDNNGSGKDDADNNDDGKDDADHEGDDGHHEDECQSDDGHDGEHDDDGDDQDHHGDDGKDDGNDDDGNDDGKDYSKIQSDDRGSVAESVSLYSSSSTDDGKDDDGKDDGKDDDGKDDGDHEDDGKDDGDHEDGHDGDHDDDDDDGDDNQACDASLTLVKTPTNEHGGNLAPEDFQLLVDGVAQDQNVAITVAADVAHEVSEIPQAGYEQRAIVCSDDDTGAAISIDGTVTPAAGQHVTCEVINDDVAPTITVSKNVVNDNGGQAMPEDFRLTVNGEMVAQDMPFDGIMANEPSIVSEEDSVPGYAPTSVECISDITDSPNNKSVADSGMIDVTPAPGENIACTITNDDVAPGLTVVKAVTNDDGGNAVVTDFPLQVNGTTVTSGTRVAYEADVDLVITEAQSTGYVAANVSCVSSDPESINNIDANDPDPAALTTVTLQPGEAVVCTVTNDDIAPTVTVHKVVIGGTKVAADFVMTVAGNPVPQDTASDTLANTPIEVSEVADPDYTITSVVCTDNADDSPLVHPVVLDEAQNATCTVTNTFNAVATITVVKSVTNLFGGTLNAADFQLRIDGDNASQNVAHEVSAGAHTISELARPGYDQTGIACVDLANNATVGNGGTISVVTGQAVKCTVSNADQAPTLTVVKHVNPDNGGTAAPSAFQLQIDGANAPQNVPQNVQNGSHTVTEVPFAGYRMVGIDCSDVTGPVPYDANTGGVNLALGQHVTCIVTNQHDPIDLAITKSVDGASHIAGGAPFDYTITVDNLGPRDAEPTDITTVTDVLPAGLSFVDFPANCSPSGQTLTCVIDPADLQVADPAVAITVTVAAGPDADSGTYTNVAFVNTPDDPACLGEGCVPVCDPQAENNNVDCVDTNVVRDAVLTIDKIDDVDNVHPGGTYAYNITVANDGPSSFQPNMTMTDDLPAGLVLVSVTAASPWTCLTTDPIVCTYGESLQPNTSTPVITITVQLDSTYLGDSVINTAQAIATIDPSHAVTTMDTETTPVIRTADLSIDKSISANPALIGGTVDWVLVVSNHGPDTATNVVISDVLPAEFTVASVSASGVSCTNTTQTVQCTTATLANGATVSVTVTANVIGPISALVTNTATVGSGSADPILTDNTDSASVPVAAVGSGGPVPPGDPGVGGVEPQLPRTGGSSPVGPLTLASLMMVAGAMALVIGRRRRTTTA